MKRSAVVVVAVFVLAAMSQVTRSSGASDKNAPTFAKDVAPIIYGKCAVCHRPGETAPMSFLSYQEVRPWSRDIKEQVAGHVMPPWFADPDSSLKFRNDRRLSPSEIETIVAWVDAGSPKGEDSDMPPSPKFAEGWTLGEPDLVIPMPVEFEIPAEGEVPMQYFYTPVPFKEDKWVAAVELRPGNAAVVHHAIVNVTRLPEGSKVVDGRAVKTTAAPTAGAVEQTGSAFREGGEVFQTQDSFNRTGAFKLVGEAPGKGAEVHQPGTAKRIPAGMYFQFNLHYQPTGRVEKDRSMLGLWFSKVPVVHEVVTKGVTDQVFVGGKELSETKMVNGKEVKTRGKIPNIPPNVENWEIVGQTTVKQNITLEAFAPHMHLRGHDIKYVLRWPDGHEQALLTVSKYDFNWQLHYELQTPLKVPAGSTIIATAHYDNSLKNKYNPAPQKEVRWAEQSWDEMFIPWFEYTVDNEDLSRASAAAASGQRK